MLEHITIPLIVPQDKILIDYENIKEFKLTYPKVKKKKNYYLAYLPDVEKYIDALTFYYLIKLFYKETIFYFIEKKDNKFIVFGGHTFGINETTFFYKEFDVDEIDELKEIDILNKRFLNTGKSIVFFINLDEDDKNYILNLLDTKEGNIKKIFTLLFTGKSVFSKYRVFIVSFAIIGFIFIGTNFYLQKKQKIITQNQEKIIQKYQQKIEKLKKEIKKLNNKLQIIKINKNVKIYKG